MVTGPLGPGPFSAVAVDLGSSSVKVLRADVAEDGAPRLVAAREVPHQPVRRGPYLEWDVVETVLDVVAQESRDALGGRVAVSLDGWGDGLVFLDRAGRRVGPVRCYRDPGLVAAAGVAHDRGYPGLVAERTGCTLGASSTLVQLRAVLDERPAWLRDVVRVVPLVDHLGDLLTRTTDGSTPVGLSPLSTSGFVDPRTGHVDRELLDRLELPARWVPDPCPELRVAGRLDPDRLAPGAQGVLVKVAGHDTATALGADPAAAPGRCFVSLGSWAVVGVVVDPARRASAPFRTLAPVMHEAAADGALRVNRNVPALRLVQQLERERLGRPATAAERSALLPPPSAWDPGPVVDVLALDVHRPLSEQVEAWGRTAGRPTGDLAAVLHELLRGVAQAVARAVDDLEAAGLADRGRGLWVSGGGVRVPALTAWVAALTGSPVERGPVAASAVGGVLGTASVVRPDGPDAAVTLDGWRRDGLLEH